MLVKLINSVLILLAVFMGVKQGWLLLAGRSELQALLLKSEVGRNVILLMGLVTLICSLLLLHPRTFFWANFLLATFILLLLCLQLRQQNWAGMLTEIPFLLLHLLVLWLPHPLLLGGHAKPQLL
jgi:hypothetical protein